MFRKNNSHDQDRLFSHFEDLDIRLKNRLLKTWAPLFYEHVFSQIDEAPFAVLYCDDNGRPNFPINILLSLEFIKHWKDLTDEELLEQASFNYQVAFAIGLRNLGEEYIAPRTLYNFRERIYRHTLENQETGDLIFDQFVKLTNHFVELAQVKTDEQRMDSTFVSPNIQKAGRMALAFDVLLHAVEQCPEEILPDNLREVATPVFKTNLLYKTKASGTQSRLESLLGLSAELLDLVKEKEELASSQPLLLLARFLREQGIWSEEDRKWKARESKDMSANSLQSAHDADATYRKKGNHTSSGYVCNLTETCSKDNEAQLITDYVLEPNTISDVTMIQNQLPDIKERTDLKNLYTDGGYYGESVDEIAREKNVELHFSAMTGKKPNADKMTFDQFEIDQKQRILTCPEKQAPDRAAFDKQSKILSAHFDVEICKQCPRLEECPVKLQKKEAVIRVSQKRLLSDETRAKLEAGGRQETTNRRAAIEGTNSALKRGQGMDKLEVCGINKCRVVVGLKVIGHNFQQTLHCLNRQLKKLAKALANPDNLPDQGVSLTC